MVIRTADAQFQAQSAWVHKLRTLVCASGYCPKTIDYLVQHEQAYQQELAFIANPPADVEIVQIFAGEKLHSKLLGSTDMDLKRDHKIGVAAGKAFLQEQYAFESAELESAQLESAELDGINQAAVYNTLGNVEFETLHEELSPEKVELKQKAPEAVIVEEIAPIEIAVADIENEDAEYGALTLEAFVASKQAPSPQRLSA